ncbi:MAG: hypothetical protein ACK5L5_00385 [Bacteroidales bacterium]
MKKVIITLFLAFSLIETIDAQKALVEKSTWGIQFGINPVNVYNETRIVDKLALRTELGLGLFYGYKAGMDEEWSTSFNASLEPRFYYNLNRRKQKSRNIGGNSGSYIAFNINYAPDFGMLSNDYEAYTTLSLTPVWGTKLNIGRRFMFEFATGLGYGTQWRDDYNYDWDTGNFYKTGKKNKYSDIMLFMRIGLGFWF